MKRTLWVLLGLLVLMGSVSAAQAPLRVGSEVAHPPLEFFDPETLEPVGFDMDLIRAIGALMGRDIEIIDTAWDVIISRLNDGDYDVIVSSMAITEERAALVDFSHPYLTTGQLLVVRADDNDIATLDDLAGKRVAIQLGTTSYALAEEVGGALLQGFDSTPAALAALKEGQADAVITDELVAIREAAQHPELLKTVGQLLTIDHFAIAVKKGRSELLDQINQALERLRADGSYDAIYRKWFGDSSRE